MAIWLLASLAPAPVVAGAAQPATVQTNQGCYLVGQAVTVSGAGFAGDAIYDIAIDGVDFGQSTTSAGGGFTSQLSPGGLGAGVLESVDRLDATDGYTDVATTFTLTRPAGARFGPATTLTTASLRAPAPFQVWDFAPDGHAAHVYLHYVRAGHAAATTVALGRTTGQCGTLRSPARPLFPFRPARGHWTLQFDTSPAYSAAPAGPVARLTLAIA